jgi:hypothetical protein
MVTSEPERQARRLGQMELEGRRRAPRQKMSRSVVEAKAVERFAPAARTLALMVPMCCDDKWRTRG